MQEIEAVQKSFPLRLRLVVIFRDFLIFHHMFLWILGMIVTQILHQDVHIVYTTHLREFFKST